MSLSPTLRTVRGGPAAAMQSPVSPQSPTTSSSQFSKSALRRSDAASQAWQDHVAKLSPVEERLFFEHKQGDLQSYFAAIRACCDNMQRSSHSIRLVKFVDPLFRVADMYVPLLAAGAQVDASPSGLVLGGLLCVLNLSTKFAGYQDKVLAALDAMAHKADLLTKLCEDIYATDDEVQSELIEVYGSILLFCRESLKLIVDDKGKPRSGLKTLGHVMLKDFESSVGQYVTAFEGHCDTLEKKMELCEKRRNRDFQAQTSQQFQSVISTQQYQTEREVRGFDSLGRGMWSLFDQQKLETEKSRLEYERALKESQRQKLLAWLPSVSFEKLNDKKFDSHLEGTGEWLLQHQSYKQWGTTDDSSLLWVKGKAGCGKSVLASLIINHIEKSKRRDDAVLYAYCNHSCPESSVLASSMLLQLCQQTSEIHPSLLEIFERTAERRSTGPNWQQIITGLTAMISLFSYTYIIVDGLDECSDQEKLSKLICTLLNDSSISIKVLILSRPSYPVLETAFANQPSLIVDTGANEGDIRMFISNLLSEDGIAMNDAMLYDSMCEKLLQKAEGMFLWVNLLKNSLRGHRTIAKFVSTVNSLLAGLDEVYEMSLIKIASQNALDRDLAFDMLMWLANSKRSLTKDELLTAVVVQPGSSKLHANEKIVGTSGLTAICADLLIIDSDGNFQLIHSSLQEYLKSLDDISEDAVKAYRQRQATAPKRMARICLTYLLFNTFKCGAAKKRAKLNSLEAKNPLLEYAACYWADHLSDYGGDELDDLVLQLAKTRGSRELTMQLKIESLGNPWTFKFRGSTNELEFLALFGFCELARREANTDVPPNKVDRSGLSPLEYAFLGQQHDVCSWLLGYEIAATPTDSFLNSPLGMLHIAASQEWLDVIDRLKELGWDLNGVSSVNQTPLTLAVNLNCDAAVRRLIEIGAKINLPDEDGKTPLLKAAENDHADLCIYLVKNGADVNAQDRKGLSAMHFAAMYNNLRLVKILIKKGAILDLQASDIGSPMHAAAQADRPDIIKLLRNAKASTTSQNRSGSTPLHLAAYNNSVKAAKALFKFDALLEAKDNRGSTPLHQASYNDQLPVAKYLCDCGAKINARDDQQNTPLHHASETEEGKIVDLLLRLGARADAKNEAGRLPLHNALGTGRYKPAKLLLAACNDLTPRDRSGSGLMHFAVLGGSEKCVRMILDAGSDLNVTNDFGRTPLRIAAMNENSETLNLMLTDGKVFNVDAKDANGDTSLHGAACFGLKENVSLLLRSGASTATTNNWGRTPLMEAIAYQHFELAGLLLDNDSSSESFSTGNNAALHSSVICERTDLVKQLLSQNTSGLEVAEDGRSAFMAAALKGSLDMIDLFLENGQDGTQQVARFGETCLHAAAVGGNPQVIERLVERGADITATNDYGQNALHVAARLGQYGVVTKLSSFGVEINATAPHAGTPLHFAIDVGDVGYLKFVDEALRVGADVEKEDALVKMTPLNLAAHRQLPLIVRRLIEAGANPLHRDLFARTALDYCLNQSDTYTQMGIIRKFYKPLELVHRQKLVRHSISTAVAEYLGMATTPANSWNATQLISVIGSLLLLLHDEVATNLGRILFQWCRYSGIECNMCSRGFEAEDWFSCSQCFNTDLCANCYHLYMNNDKATSSIRQGFGTLVQLDGELRNIMVHLEPLLHAGFATACEPFAQDEELKTWLKQKRSMYDRLEKEYGVSRNRAEFEPLGRYFLNAISAEVLDRNATAPTASAINLDQKKTEFDKIKAAIEKEECVLMFSCKDHEYIEMTTKDWAKLQADGEIFNADDTVNSAWLEKVAKMYAVSAEELKIAQDAAAKLDQDILQAAESARFETVIEFSEIPESAGVSNSIGNAESGYPDAQLKGYDSKEDLSDDLDDDSGGTSDYDSDSDSDLSSEYDEEKDRAIRKVIARIREAIWPDLA